MSALQSVVISQKVDGSWQAHHVPSGRVTHGLTKDEAEQAMAEQLGVDADGKHDEPLTSDRFGPGLARDLALYLEGEVSAMLAHHSGFARLEAYEAQVAHVRLGGGCQGCPSSTITLLNGVVGMLRDHFGDDAVADVVPVT